MSLLFNQEKFVTENIIGYIHFEMKSDCFMFLDFLCKQTSLCKSAEKATLSASFLPPFSVEIHSDINESICSYRSKYILFRVYPFFKGFHCMGKQT